MKIHIAGLNHKTAPIELRERVAFEQAELETSLRSLKTWEGLSEGMILSTCNRVEVLVSTPDQSDPKTAIENFLHAARNVPREKLNGHLYHLEGSDAIRHLFRVASSLDSMVVGEPQILGQIKAAYSLAKSAGTVGNELDFLLTRAFSVAKRVRTETEIGASAVSISFAAVELAREIFGSLKGKKVMLIGAGKMSELAARHLQRSGTGEVLVTNRTRARAEVMAKRFSGKVVDYDNLLTALTQVDIAITSSAAPRHILTEENMRPVMAARRHRPMFLIDIAVPRNIDPVVNTLEAVFLYDIDDLGRVVAKNVDGRKAEAQAAESIISEEVEKLLERLAARQLTPVILRLQEQVEVWRKAELERARSKLGDLTPGQQEAIEAVTRSLANKMLHGPMSELRASASKPAGDQTADIIRRIFRLGDV